MYSREMGGIRSDGQLYGMQQELQQGLLREQVPSEPIQQQSESYGATATAAPPREEPAAEETFAPRQESCASPSRGGSRSGGLLNLSFLHDLKTEDLLLMAIAFLLFTDGGDGQNNDLLILLVGLLLLL